jgi:hypothetical protein
LRRRIGGLELAAERHGQFRLAMTIAARGAEGDRAAAAETNLALYLGAEAQSAEAIILRQALSDFIARG